MGRFVLAVSLAHLMLLSAYVKLGAVKPWQAVDLAFGGGQLWDVMMLSAASAPFLLGAVLWVTALSLRRFSHPWIRKTCESAFIVLGIGALLSLGNAILLADRRIEDGFRALLVTFINEHILGVVTILVVAGSVLLTISWGSTAIRERLTRFLRVALYILAPSVLFSVVGVFYLYVLAPSPERSGEPPSSQPSLASCLPKSIVVLLFDALSYGIVFNNHEVDKRLPNLQALAKQALVFHDVPSFPGGTRQNVPILLTGQLPPEYGINSYHSNLFELAHDQGYRLAVLGYFLDYCSTYVQNKGYCQIILGDEWHTEPPTFLKAFLEVYQLAVAKALPIAVEFGLESRLDSPLLREMEVRMSGHNNLLMFLKDAKGSFIYAHYPIPHTPYVRFKPKTRQLQTAGATYFDSVKTVDAFLGQIRQTLRASGRWDATMLILLADHHLPEVTSDIRTPLIVKLPYMKQRLDYDGTWTHAQFVPLLEELFKRCSFDPNTAMTVVHTLAPSVVIP